MKLNVYVMPSRVKQTKHCNKKIPNTKQNFDLLNNSSFIKRVYCFQSVFFHLIHSNLKFDLEIKYCLCESNSNRNYIRYIQ